MLAETLRTRLLPSGRETDGTLGHVIDGSCQTFVSDCHVRAAAELISHTWDPVLLSALRAGATRRRELLARIGGISDKALTESLRRARAHGLVERAPGGDGPASAGATYRLSPLGRSFADGPLAALAGWAADHQDRLGDAATPS